MATKKAAGSSKNNRDSRSKRRGVKVYAGQTINAGGIIVRQKGTKYFAGENVGMGKDFTLYALKNGKVNYSVGRKVKYDGRIYHNTIVNVTEAATA